MKSSQFSPWRKRGFLATFVSLFLVCPETHSQCVAKSQNFNEPLGDPVTIAEEIKPAQILRDLFQFFRLSRK